jgi:hypothetical protein
MTCAYSPSGNLVACGGLVRPHARGSPLSFRSSAACVPETIRRGPPQCAIIRANGVHRRAVAPRRYLSIGRRARGNSVRIQDNICSIYDLKNKDQQIKVTRELQEVQ